MIETDARQSAVTIFGGKLTDCLNVGREVAEQVQALGVTLRPDDDTWFGEPSAAERAEFLKHSRQLGLDDLSGIPGTAQRLWRRYGARAKGILERIRADQRLAQPIFEGGFLRAEIQDIGEHEMVVTTEDFLRRRSDLALVTRATQLQEHPDGSELERLLFPDNGPQISRGARG